MRELGKFLVQIEADQLKKKREQEEKDNKKKKGKKNK